VSKPAWTAILLALAALGALAALDADAHADVTNRGFLPFGERASMLGNAGLCSPTGEAVYYNPANLTRLDHASLSVSGSTYLRYDLSATPLLVLQGRDQPFSASGFVAIPSTVTSTYQVGDWSLATAILVPEALDSKNRVAFETPDLHITLLQQHTVESLWLGAAAARRITPHLSIGVSLFAAREKESDFSFTRAEVADTVQEVTSNEDVAVYNASAVLGVYWEPMPALGVALRVQSPTVQLAGSSDLYQSTLVAGTTDQHQELVVDGAKASRPLPTDLSLGISIRPRPGIELVVDAGLQLPATFNTLDDPIAGVRTQEVHLAPRVGIGAELEVGHHKWIRLGGLYNRSATATPVTAADESRDDYVGVTAGFSIQKDRVVTSLGAFGLQSNTQLIVTGADPPRLSDARVRLYGALLAFSYRL
jgi:hypothetical protein